jgi:hypothetical protein
MVNGRTDAEDMERQYQLAALRDTFAAAALTGLVASNADLEDTMQGVCESAYSWADAMLRERNGAVESRETVQDGVVPTATWFDQKIAEECRIAQAEAARLRLTDSEREAIEQMLDEVSGKACAESWVPDILRNLLERTT